MAMRSYSLLVKKNFVVTVIAESRERANALLESSVCFKCFGDDAENILASCFDFSPNTASIDEALPEGLVDERLQPKRFFYGFNVDQDDIIESAPLKLLVSPVEVGVDDPIGDYLERMLFCADKVILYIKQDEVTWPLQDDAEIDCRVKSSEHYLHRSHDVLVQALRSYYSLTVDEDRDMFLWDIIVPACSGDKLISFIIPPVTPQGMHEDFSVVLSQSEEVEIEQAVPMDIDANEEAPAEDAVVVVDAKASQIVYAPPPIVHISQQAIADVLFEKSLACLGVEDEDGLQKKFDDMQFLIVVPRFNTLKEQTLERAAQFSDLAKGDLVACMIYPCFGRDSDLFKDRIMKNDKTLFVMVVDECHYGPTLTGISMLQDIELRNRSNFLVLLVSATPYNCLSNMTSVHDKNIVEWGKVLKNANHSTTYVGFEYYARSMAFRVLSLYSLDIRVEFDSGDVLEGSLSIDLKDREFASFGSFSKAVNEILNTSLFFSNGDDVKLKLGFSGSVFSLTSTFSKKKKLTTVRVSSADGIMVALGFDASAVELCSKGPLTVKASGKIGIDASSPIHTRHIRCDAAFQTVKDAVEAKKSLQQYKNCGKKAADGCDDGEVEECDSDVKVGAVLSSPYELEFLRKPAGDLREETLMKPRNGFIIVMDYIFSLVYFSLRIVNPLSEDMRLAAKMFVVRLQDCCYCIPADLKIKQRCDLLPLADFILSMMLTSKAGENGCTVNKDNWLDLLGEILHEKKIAEDEFDMRNSYDSESWFTETDRIVKQLLMDRPTKPNAQEAPSAGLRNSPSPMVMLRVFDNDENLSMQAVLRHARDHLCNLPPDEPRLEQAWRFSIIGDISSTRLNESLEEEFRTTPSESNGDLTLEEVAKRQNDELKYEDLQGLPCLVILCEKGRMGDTFPHSLRYIDLRLRTAQAGSALIQELGRMCRYASSDRNTACVVHLGDDEDKELLYEGSEMTKTLFQDKFPFGVQIFNTFSNVYVGVAENVIQLKYVLTAHDLTQATICRLKFPLPTALIYKKVSDTIEQAVDARENFIFKDTVYQSRQQLESARNERTVLNCLKFSILDDYLTRNKKLSVLDRDQFKLKLPPVQERDQSDKTKKRSQRSHYDCINLDFARHDRRLLLWAECQIGKTGAFLAFLDRLYSTLAPADLVPPPLPPIPVKDKVDWCVPYWQEIAEQGPWKYGGPSTGKYVAILAKQRYMAFLKALECNEGERTRYFQEKMFRLEYPASNRGLGKLLLLNNLTPSMETVKAFVNWDGRISSELLEDLHEPSEEQLEGFEDELDRHFWRKEEDQPYHCFPQGVSFPPLDKQLMAKSRCLGSSQLSLLSDAYVLTLRMPEDIGRGSCQVHLPATLVSMDESLKNLAAAGDVKEFCKALLNFQSRSGVRYWTFSPSYIGKHGIKYMRLDRSTMYPGLELWKDYVQVLVVRAHQFEVYREYYGKDYIILSLPEELFYDDPRPTAKKLRDAFQDEMQFTPENGGPGYVRLFIQRFAEIVGLDAIWIIDDNVSSTYRIDRNSQSPIKQVPFLRVMQHIEAIFDRKEVDLNHITGQDGQWAVNHSRSSISDLPTTIRGHQPSNYDGSTAASSLTDMIGHPLTQYGAIGMGRVLNQQQRRPTKHPIKCGYSVYSFYLFNVKAAWRCKLYYPPRKTMEDIEMNFMMEEAGLVVCKLQMYCHVKPVRKSEISRPDNNVDQLMHELQIAMKAPFAIRQFIVNPPAPDDPLLGLSRGICANLHRTNQFVQDTKDCKGIVYFVHGLHIQPDFDLATVLRVSSASITHASDGVEATDAALSAVWTLDFDIVFVFNKSFFGEVPILHPFLSRVDLPALDLVLFFKSNSKAADEQSAILSATPVRNNRSDHSDDMDSEYVSTPRSESKHVEIELPGIGKPASGKKRLLHVEMHSPAPLAAFKKARLDFDPNDSVGSVSLDDEAPNSRRVDLPTPADAVSTPPLNNKDIIAAAKLWCSDRAAAELKYGHVSNWNTSQVTNMAALWKSQKFFNDDISAWDVSSVTNMSKMFSGAILFNQALEKWQVHSVTNMTSMFHNAIAFNQPLDGWKVANVSTMKGMFASAVAFNQPLNSWNVSHVRDMSEMFASASVFNSPIGDWKVGTVTDMGRMFEGAKSFNQPLNGWNVSHVKRLRCMFVGAAEFNQPLKDWDVGSVETMEKMFERAVKFNQPLAGWRVNQVRDFGSLFKDASSFNQPLDSWNLDAAVLIMSSVFEGAASFNQPLNNWNVSKATSMLRMFKSAIAFNQPLHDWDVSNVKTLKEMFHGASSFNPSLKSGWKISRKTIVDGMFEVSASSSTDPPPTPTNV